MKYLKVADQFRKQVRSGVLSPGERLPSLSAMRERGVGQNTLEKAHALLEREGLIVRQHRRGVFVAEPKTERATGIIGVLGHALMYRAEVPYWAHLLGGIRATAHERGREVLLLGNSTPGLGWEKIDGVLSFGIRHDEEKQCELPPGMPGVSLIHPSRLMPSVIANDYAGAKAATEHLLQLGHRRIAFLCNSQTKGGRQLPSRRIEGYCAALWEAGIEPNPNWSRQLLQTGEGKFEFPQSFDELGHDKMSRWLREDWTELGCTALLAQNDETAIGAMAALREAGVAVPEEVSVVGFDGTKVGEYCTPRLTSVGMPLHEIGEAGVNLLLRCIAEEEVEVMATVLPTQLIVRNSTAPPPHKS